MSLADFEFMNLWKWLCNVYVLCCK